MNIEQRHFQTSVMCLSSAEVVLVQLLNQFQAGCLATMSNGSKSNIEMRWERGRMLWPDWNEIEMKLKWNERVQLRTSSIDAILKNPREC